MHDTLQMMKDRERSLTALTRGRRVDNSNNKALILTFFRIEGMLLNIFFMYRRNIADCIYSELKIKNLFYILD